MSINSCSINEFTINTLCSRRRQAIIDNLRPTTSGPGSQLHVRPDSQAFYNVTRRERPVFDDIGEMSHMQVVVEFMGQTFTQTLERSDLDNIVMINVSGLTHTSQSIQVNISDIKVIRVKS